MDSNISRVILITGAVVIVLLILSISIYYVQKSEIFINLFSNSIDEIELKDHNNRYVIYEGTVVGTEIINLANRIVLNNKSDNILGMSMSLVDGNTIIEITPSDSSQLGNLINSVIKTRAYIGTSTINDVGLIVKLTFSLK